MHGLLCSKAQAALFHSHFWNQDADKEGTDQRPSSHAQIPQAPARSVPTYLKLLPILRVPISWHSQQHIWKGIALSQKAPTRMRAVGETVRAKIVRTIPGFQDRKMLRLRAGRGSGRQGSEGKDRTEGT